ncbi:hypothetical protein RCH14_004488 [Massilia sp. MP_M2]|uniref:hypothetical protein n=1 Tax=Massilia sp. MP_M2 TaxID=3071713 RepID=UPI00319D8C61
MNLLDRLIPETDRTSLFACLLAPLILAVAAFILAVSLTAVSVPISGTLRSTVAALSFVYLTLALAWLPAYTIALAWFWITTRNDEAIFPRLYWVPVIQTLFIWFPTIFFLDVPTAQKLRMIPPWGIASIVLGFVFIGLIRGIFYLWKRK